MIRLNMRVFLFIIFIMSTWFSPTLYAHLLPKQRGTLNFVDNGAYMALSLPVSGFEGLDDNKNGTVSMFEFNKHRAEIMAQIRTNIVLSEKGENHELQGIMLSPVGIDEHAITSVETNLSRIYVMGKFVFQSSNDNLRFRNGIYGNQVSERTFKISAKRKSDGKNETFELTSAAPSKILFSEESEFISKP